MAGNIEKDLDFELSRNRLLGRSRLAFPKALRTMRSAQDRRGGMADTETVDYTRFIRRAQDFGFSLKEINELLSLRANPSTDCADIREITVKSMSLPVQAAPFHP